MLKKSFGAFSAVRLWELYQSERLPKRAKVKGVIIWGYPLPPWTIAPNAIALNYLITLVLSVVAMLAEKSSRLKVLKRRLAKEG